MVSQPYDGRQVEFTKRADLAVAILADYRDYVIYR